MHAFIPIVALLGLAAAQSETTNTASGTSSSTDPTATCLAACKAGDVNCQAQCVNVPFPDESQINATLACSTNECSQGDGGPSDTKKYGDCLASCAADFYYTSGATPTGVATANTLPTGSSSPGSSSAETTTGSGSSASATGGSSSSSSETRSSDESEGASSTASGASESASSSASGSAGAAESTGAANALSLSNEMITVSGGVFGLVVAALAL